LSWIVKCPICSREYHIAGLGSHLSTKHNTTLKNFPELRELQSKYVRECIAPKYRGKPSPRKGKTWEEIYGAEKAKLLKQKLRERNEKLGIFCNRGDKNPMRDPVIREKWKKIITSPEYRLKKSKIAKKLMNDPEFKSRWYKRYIELTYGAITNVAKQLEQQGYRVIPLHHGYPVPDIIAIKDGNVYAVEVVKSLKQITPQKYINCKYYNDIWWVVYKPQEGGDVDG